MAKDGTMRGGQRPNTGPKGKSLAEKIAEGKISVELPEPMDIEGYDMPPVKEYLKAKQRNGGDLIAEEVYRETWEWLSKCDCAHIVNVQLLTNYAMSVARWVQCEEAISEFGLLAKHPTTGNPIASPYVSMSRDYMKQVNQLWYPISQVVRENALSPSTDISPQDKLMEKLLKDRSGG